MKKVLLSLVVVSALVTAGEFQYGKGTFTMNGGFLGLTESIDTDIDTFTYVDRHSNIAGSAFFYGYDFTWMDSQTLKQAQHIYNNSVAGNSMLNKTIAYENPMGGSAIPSSNPSDNSAPSNNPPTLENPSSASVPSNGMKPSIPAMEYRVKGLDANIRLGYDVVHQDQDNFLGLGLLLGVSMPWIDSSKSDSASPSLSFIRDNAGNILEAGDYFKDSETTVMSYKLGPTVNFQKTLIGNKLSVYGTGSYAYQTGYIENDLINSDFSVDGIFQEYNIGLYFTPFTEEYKWGWLTLSPRIYATVGYKYSKWDVDKVSINMSGAKLDSDTLDPLAMDFSMESSTGYFGVGYSF